MNSCYIKKKYDFLGEIFFIFFNFDMKIYLIYLMIYMGFNNFLYLFYDFDFINYYFVILFV